MLPKVAVGQSFARFSQVYPIFHNFGTYLLLCSCPTATWNQFDGVAYVYGDKGMFSRFMDYFSKDKTVEYRTKALMCFVPKWGGFVVNEPTEKMNATEALMKLQKVVKCLTNVWVQEGGYRRQKQPTNFDVRKVIYLSCDMLKCGFFNYNMGVGPWLLYFNYSVIALETLWFDTVVNGADNHVW